jgi:LacI family transcriptional regulator
MSGLATIYDVAAKAGVSIKTVSRVMNDEQNVRDSMRAKVRVAAAALNYRPSLSARSLAGSRSFVIAGFVDAALTLEHWRSERGTDYVARILLGVMLPCRDAGYHFILELVDHDPASVRQTVAGVLSSLKPDGVILTPPSADNLIVLDVLRQAQTPYVRLGPARAKGGGLRLMMDEAVAAVGMVDHLVGLGHRAIGFIEGEKRYGSSRARRQGFEKAMARHGLKTPWIAEGDYTYASGMKAARSLLIARRRPTAIFASNDDMALGCMAVAGELGLDVPNDLSIAGFDDSTGSRFSRPQLTSVRQPLVQLAEGAVRALIGGEVAPDCDRADTLKLAPYTLVPRASTAPPRL